MLRLNSSILTSIFNKKKEAGEYFLTLHIKPYSVGAILLVKKEKHLFIAASYESSLTQHVDTLPPQELLEYADKAVSSIESSVVKGSEIEKTIFALPSHWVEDAKIKRDHLLTLKKITDDLALVPIGFLVSTEAIIHELQKKEGAPLSAILIEIIGEELFLSLVKQGEILEEDRATIQESSIATAELLLHNLKAVEVLPSRIILVENDKSNKDQQAFISHTFPKSIPFLHIPQVEVLDKMFEQESVIHGVGDQLGLEIQIDHFPEKISHEETHEEVVDEDFGFVKEKDLSQMEKGEIHEESDVIPVEDQKDSRISHHTEHEISSRREDGTQDMEKDMVEEREDIPQEHKNKGKKAAPLQFLFNLGSFLSFPKTVLKSPGLITLPIAGIVVVFAFWYAYTTYIVKTTVTLFAKVEEVKVDEKITLSEDEAGDGNVLRLAKFQEEEEGEVSIETTGEKESGDKAKGEVTVFNKTEKEKSFPKGTTLVGTNKLEFVTLDDITIASTSAFSTEFSNKKVKVEAKTFGKEQNLPSKTNFEFKEFPASSYFAKNDQAFGGGTKKTSQVVSEEDLKNLESELIKSLSEKAKESVQKKLTNSQVLITAPIDSTISDSDYSNKKGDEVKEVSLTGKVLITLGAYDQMDMASLVKKMKEGNIPADYEIDRSHTSLTLEDISVGKEISAKLVGTTLFQPKVEVENIKTKIKGKTVAGAQKTLKEIGGIEEIRIKQNINLPFLGSFISRNPAHIVLEVKAE